MAYEVITYPDERLKLVSTPIEKIDDKLKKLVNDMFDIMYKTDGIGLSAVQIGVLSRLFVMDINNTQYVMINPEIIKESDEKNTFEEGCLSFPGISAKITRPKKITIQYMDIEGKRKNFKASGLVATCIQHEYDHLQGKSFVDHLPLDEKIDLLHEYREINNL